MSKLEDLKITRSAVSSELYRLSEQTRKLEDEVAFLDAQIFWEESEQSPEWELVEDWSKLVVGETARVSILRYEDGSSAFLEGDVRQYGPNPSRAITSWGQTFTAVYGTGEIVQPKETTKVRVWRKI
mgnify:CR=1 FL=1